MSADREAVVHEATPLRGFGRTKDEDLHSRVTLQVDAGHMDLHRQERCGRSDAPLPPWETDPEAGIVLPREALANLAMALLPHLTGDELRRVAEAMPRVAGEWYAIEDQWVRDADDECGELAAVRDVGDTDPVWEAWTCVGAGDVESEHPTARAAQAACDARLEAAGVRLCGEVVRDG